MGETKGSLSSRDDVSSSPSFGAPPVRPRQAEFRTHASRDIPCLDGIRAIAVLIVVVAHSGLERIVPGGLGVTVFFFLSGYLITTLLIDEKHNHGQISVGKFYLRRFFRLSPPLFITLILAYALVLSGVQPGGATLQGFLAQAFYFANFYQIFFDVGGTVPMGTGVLWSLAVEEHFYIVYPLILSIMFRVLSQPRIALTLGVVCVLVLAWRYQLHVVGGAIPERTYYATDARIDSIVFGCILALWRNPADQLTAHTATPTRIEWTLLVLGFALLLVSLLYRSPSFRETARYTFQGLALLPIFFFVIKYHHLRVFAFLNSKLFRTLGVYSYAIYLIHHVVIFFVKQNWPALDKVWVLLVIAMLASVVYAAVLDRFVEPPFRRLRARFR